MNDPGRQLRGLEKICKMYGRMKCGDVMWAWDYVNEVAVHEKVLRADKPRWRASEKARWQQLRSVMGEQVAKEEAQSTVGQDAGREVQDR